MIGNPSGREEQPIRVRHQPALEFRETELRLGRGGDLTDGRSGWKASTAPSRVKPFMLETGVIVAVASGDPGLRFQVNTLQGDFSFRAGDVPWGTSPPQEQDFPGIADGKDDAWLELRRVQSRWPDAAQVGADGRGASCRL
jgi:hypothetical protein